MMPTTDNYSTLATVMDKVMRLFFCLLIIAALFLHWFPGMIGPHPIEVPVSGWFTFLLSPFLVIMIINDLSRIFPLDLQLLLIVVTLWSAPILSLLNLLLMIRRHNFVLAVHRMILGMSFGAMIIAIFPIALAGVFLVGFWVYLALLIILVIYEVIVYVTMQRFTATPSS